MKITKEEAGRRAVDACCRVVQIAAATIQAGCGADEALVGVLKVASEGVGYDDAAAYAIMADQPHGDDQTEPLKTALENLVKYVERNECRHEETHRGGAIWTICDSCGQEWADDRGGFQPYKEPKELMDAYEALGKKEE